jgi:hypothetical protein
MTEKERVESVRFFLEKNKTEFAKVLGYTTPQSYTSYLSGKSSASIKMIKSLVQHDKRFNINWILFGHGQMLIEESSSNTQNINNKNGIVSQVANNSHNSTADKGKELEYLQNENELLKKALKDKEEIIQLLKR